MITVDIESTKIVEGAPLSPTPVGIAVRYQYGVMTYMRWGHPSGNNCSLEEAAQFIADIWGLEWVTHNGLGFDVPVLQRYFGLPERSPLLTHDTLFLAYLHDPNARSLSLKDLGNDWLGIPPDQQQELYDWIMLNVPECRSRKQCGMYIADAPGDLVGEYAIQDVVLTHALYEHLKDLVLPAMQEPYDRERKLAPILSEMQYVGVRIDMERIEADTAAAVQELARLDQMVRDTLCCPDLDINKDAQLLAALRKNGYNNFLTTPTGKPSAAKDSLDQALEGHPELRALLLRRATYATLVSTFLLPYVALAKANGGRLHPSYNQVRNPDGYGTRTGRLSCQNPNFQNQPRTQEGYPSIRSYFLPEVGHLWLTGDFKSQEPRLAAHFEGGALMQAYNQDPELDSYLWVAELCGVKRKEAKTIFLGLLYAMGAASLGEQLGCTSEQATHLRNTIKAALPDVVRLDYEAKRRWQHGLPIKTIGGRLMHCEPPTGHRRWEYKALNTLIQGSAADQAKEALIYTHSQLLPGERILGTVHDEISVSCESLAVLRVSKLLNDAANVLPADVPFLMDIGWGANWSEAK